jgi:hypothetical protein
MMGRGQDLEPFIMKMDCLHITPNKFDMGGKMN